MIAWLAGTIVHKDDEHCVLATAGGVGYELRCPTGTLAALPREGERAEMHVQTIVREEALDLYGFQDRDQRDCFALLLGISKLGPKTAINILSVYGPDDLRRIVLEEDHLALNAVPGIGKKSGQHIFLELSYKLKASTSSRKAAAPPVLAGKSAVWRDALTGLVNLGYVEEEVRPHLDEVLAAEPDLDVTAALRAVLKRLMKK